jgi:hypothetical protein
VLGRAGDRHLGTRRIVAISLLFNQRKERNEKTKKEGDTDIGE